MKNYKLRDKQKRLEVDIENVHKDDICIENPVELTTNLQKLQDDNRSIDLMGELKLQDKMYIPIHFIDL